VTAAFCKTVVLAFPVRWEVEPIAIDDNAVRKIDGVDR
jgi:hypothetical protein